jgi:hypothetical protein
MQLHRSTTASPQFMGCRRVGLDKGAAQIGPAVSKRQHPVNLRELGAAHCWGLTRTPGAMVDHPK